MFLLQVPVQQEEAGHEEDVGEDPCHGVAIAHAKETESRDEPQAHAAPRYHLHHPGEHGEVAITQALDAVTEDGEQAEHRIEIATYAHEHGGVVGHGLTAAVDEQLHHVAGKGEDDERREHEIYHHDLHRRPLAMAHAVEPSGPDVLSAIGCHGHADVVEHADEQVLDAHRRRERGHVDGAEGVVGTLQQDDAYGGNRHLQAHWYAVVEQYGHALVVEGAFVAMGYEHGHVARHVPHAQDGGEQLRQQRGQARSGHAHAEDEDEQHVEQDVDKRRYDEEEEWLARVAKGADVAGEEVEGERERYGEKLQEQEGVGVVEDLARRVHDTQNLVAEGASEKGYHDNHNQAHAYGVGHVNSHLLKVLRPESPRYWYGETGARPVAEAHDEKHDRCRRAHGGEGVDSYPTPHDGGVYNEVHLLKDVAQYQWNGKLYDAVGGIAHGHVVGRDFVRHCLIVILNAPSPCSSPTQGRDTGRGHERP